MSLPLKDFRTGITESIKVDPVCRRCNLVRGPAAPFDKLRAAS